MYRQILQPLLFLLNPEKAHHLTFNSLKQLYSLTPLRNSLEHNYSYNNDKLRKEHFGLHFKNPVGLAAGMDKNGEFINELATFGFGFIEIGTVTPLPQSGNPKPRLFRLKKDQALINRMGFNNAGADAVAANLKKRKTEIIIGGNIGKNKITPNEKAVNDYIICFRKLFNLVDYFVVNVSSPNTPGLRSLQEKGPLTNILSSLQHENHLKPIQKPILLKIAPDLTEPQLLEILEIVEETNINGIIATNTTIERNSLQTSASKITSIGAGGLSGKPLLNSSTRIVQFLSSRSNGKIPIIGVGGILSGEDALEKMQAGADLVQVYSGIIYKGPSLIKNICKRLAR